MHDEVKRALSEATEEDRSLAHPSAPMVSTESDVGTHALRQPERRPVSQPLAPSDEAHPQGTDPEFFIRELVIPLAQVLGNRWVEALPRHTERGMRGLLGQLVDGLTSPDRPGPTAEYTQAQLLKYVESRPGSIAELRRVARPRVAVEGQVDADRKQIDRYLAMLTFVFDRVTRLGRPVALRGFFNSMDCVTVIDTRVERDSGPELPWVLPDVSSRSFPPRIVFADSAVEAFHYLSFPRVWIMHAMLADRDSLAAELNKRFTGPPEQVSSSIILEHDLPKEPAPFELVKAIEKDLVHIAEPEQERERPSSDLSPEDRVRDDRYTRPTSF